MSDTASDTGSSKANRRRLRDAAAEPAVTEMTVPSTPVRVPAGTPTSSASL